MPEPRMNVTKIVTDEFSEITLLIADRATLFRHGILGLLKEHRARWCCAESSTLDGVLAHLRAEPVDILLYDMQLGGQAEIASLGQLRTEFPQQLIVAMADQADRAVILEALAAGANGYVLKSTTLPQLLRAIETVLSGAVFAPATLAGIPSTPAKSAQPEVNPPARQFDRAASRGVSAFSRRLCHQDDRTPPRAGDRDGKGPSGGDLSRSRRT